MATTHQPHRFGKSLGALAGLADLLMMVGYRVLCQDGRQNGAAQVGLQEANDGRTLLFSIFNFHQGLIRPASDHPA